MATSPTSTNERILEASLKLFNEQGFQNVPLMRIAMHLGISAGHLAYHYKSKIDIVMAVLPRIESEVRDGLLETNRPDQPFVATDAAQHQIDIFRTLWRYRFFFNALTQLLPKHAELHDGFIRLQANVTGAMQKMLDDLIAQGHLLAVPPPNSTAMVSKTAWMMWLSWLRFEQIEHPHRTQVRNEAVYDGIMQTFSIIQPYFEPSFADEMLAELKRLLMPAESARSRSSSGTKGVVRRKDR